MPRERNSSAYIHPASPDSVATSKHRDSFPDHRRSRCYYHCSAGCYIDEHLHEKPYQCYTAVASLGAASGRVASTPSITVAPPE